MNKLPSEIRAYTSFIFDLDNTLYQESDFLFNVYDQLGKFISEKNNISSQLVFQFLKHEFESSGRDKLFQKLNQHFGLQYQADEYLYIMRNTVVKNLSLFPVYYEVLSCLNNIKANVFILTNGNVLQQKHKVASIDWKGFDKNIVYYFAGDYAPKPDAEAVNRIIVENNIEKGSVLFIGDSLVDETCAMNAEVDFMYNTQFEQIWLQNKE